MPRPVDDDAGLRAENLALRRRIEELEAEAARRHSAELLQERAFGETVIERAAEGICVCHAVPEHPFVRFTLWNPRMVAITGYSMDEINRLGWYQSMYPDPEVQAKARKRMEAMRDGDDLMYERWQVTRADGETRTLGISTSLLTTPDGTTHALALMQDVSVEESYRRQLEERMTTLEGLLSICSSCKKIRGDEGAWHPLEAYVTDHSAATFTHGFCPDCVRTLYPDFESRR